MSNKVKLVVLAYLTFLVLNALDILTTYIALSLGAVEGNVYALSWNIPMMIGFKIMIFIALALCIYQWIRILPKVESCRLRQILYFVLLLSLIVGSLWYLKVVWSNLTVIFNLW